MKSSSLALLSAMGLLIALPADAAAQYVYPLQGQDQAKQASDEADCSKWAAQQVGFGSASSWQSAPTGTQSDTSTVLGALPSDLGGLQGGPAGALGGGGPGEVGAADSALTSGAGGPVGAQGEASVGDIGGGGDQADYNKARAACLTSRGYSVH